MKKIIVVMMLAALMFCATATAYAQTAVSQPVQNNVLQAATEQGNLKTFTGAVDTAGLRNMLSGPGPYTIFAPTDDAFNRLSQATLNTYTSDSSKMSTLVKNHVMSGRYTVRDLAKLGYVTTLDNKKIPVTSSDSTFAVDGAHIIKNDMSAGNGIIHVIDTVMIPK